jgi:RND family efflux transporter MFP subunit
MGNSNEQERVQLVEKLRLDRDSRAGAGAARRSWRSWRSWKGPAAAVVAVLAAMAWLASGGEEERPVVQTAVARAAAEVPADTSVLDASGYVTARRDATVSAKITGKVTEVLIEEGMRVEEGAVLARLDDTEARAALLHAQAQLTTARSDLEVLRADLAQAERDYARQASLTREQVGSRQELERAGALRDTLRARLTNAETRINVAEKAVEVAEVQLDDTVIRAPFSGIVVAKAAQPGEMISPISAGGGFTRTGIGTIVDMDSLEFEIDVNESFIGRVSAGQPVRATLNAYPDWKIPGRVIAVIPTADRSKATIKVRVAIESKDPRIVPDMGVRVSFLRSGAPSTTGVWVPNDAIVAQGDARIVYVLDGDRVSRRTVTAGEVAQAESQVTSGIAAGETVVVSPPATLEDGARVRTAAAE